MAASLGLNPEANFFAAPCSYSSPFLADYAPDTAFSGDLDDDLRHHLQYTQQAPVIFSGAEDDRRDYKKMRCVGDDEKMRPTANGRIGFRTRSEVEILDDGFKWRKYGKKAVKNSPNPRNYYRCSSEGCGVKKRVERDRQDPRYVITTYDGVHNHHAAAVHYAAFYSSPPHSGSPPAVSSSSYLGSLPF